MKTLSSGIVVVTLIYSVMALWAGSGEAKAHGLGHMQKDAGHSQLADGNVLGRWCDLMVPGNKRFRREITIVATGNGLVALTRLFDGSRQTLRLHESGSFMMVVNSGSGDAFRISGGTGNLQLLDRDGFIRSARRLENSPRPGDCLP